MSRFSRARNVKDPVAALTARGDCQCMKKVKPPIAPEGCIEPYVTGPNILQDPGAENTAAGTEIPYVNFFYGYPPYLIYSDFSAASSQGFVQTSDVEWPVISTAGPFSGSKHIRCGPDFDGYELIVRGLHMCDFDDTTDLGGGWLGFYSAIVVPGDIVDFSCYAKFAGATTSEIGMWIDFYTSGAAYITSIFTETALTTSYAQYSVSTVAPANAHYTVAYAEPGWTGPQGTHWDLDQFVLSIT